MHNKCISSLTICHRAGLLLRQRTDDCDEQFAFGIKRPDVFLFKIYLAVDFIEFSDALD